jgi:uncharacterized protein with NAD-binding domain and iron-sulfur cluster
MNIVIFGAGVGGLTVAHQLIRNYPEATITIYEKKNVVGGLARSSRDPEGYPTEYCWRVFFGFYKNLLKLKSEIPDADPMTIYKHLNIDDANTESFYNKLLAYLAIFNGITSCDQRLNQDTLTWWNSIAETSKYNQYRNIGGWLGMDRFQGSYNSVIRVGIEQQMLQSYDDYVTTKPTSEALFDPWVKDLQRRGVNIKLNHELESLEIVDSKISSAVVSGQKVAADIFVLAVPIEVLSTLNVIPNMSQLRDISLHMQLSFQVFFDRKISLGDTNGFLMVDSPWDLIVLSYDSIYTHPRFKGGWSVAVCTAYVNGLNGKPFYKCSYPEILNELTQQLSQSDKLQRLLVKHNGVKFSPEIIVHWAPMWDTFKYNGSQIYTTEPKFTNNVGTLNLRPSFKTRYPNLYLSTGYIKETLDIFSMEAACIAGKRVADDILKQYKLPSQSTPIILNRPLLFAPFRMIDTVAYAVNLPNINLLLIVMIVVFVLYKTCGLLFKK